MLYTARSSDAAHERPFSANIRLWQFIFQSRAHVDRIFALHLLIILLRSLHILRISISPLSVAPTLAPLGRFGPLEAIVAAEIPLPFDRATVCGT